MNVNTPGEWLRATDLVRSPGPRSTSVIVPALNEEASIARVVADFLPRVDEVLVVDNLSTDRTAERARAAGARVETVSVGGYGDALRHGMNHATGDVFVLVEADHSFRADDLDKLLSFLPSADMVIGTRTTKHHRAGSNMGPLLRGGTSPSAARPGWSQSPASRTWAAPTAPSGDRPGRRCASAPSTTGRPSAPR